MKPLLRRCVIHADEPATPLLRRSLSEARRYLEELTGEAVPILDRVGNVEGNVVAVGERPAGALFGGPGGPRRGGDEAFRLRVEPRMPAADRTPAPAGLRASAVGSTETGTARAISRLLGMIELADGRAVLPAPVDAESEPRYRLRGMHMNGWAAGYPYSFRCWNEEDWRRYVDILFHLGVNLFFLWPSIEIIPLPLSPEDEGYLEEVRRIVTYAREERGMEVWLLQSANRVALSDCGVRDPRLRPYWLPEAQVDLDPGRPDHRERILLSREPLYRLVDNADGVVVIDSDPGGWEGSPVPAYIELLRRTRAMLDRLSARGPAVKLVSWLWQGWGHTSWDPGAREPVISETTSLMRERLEGPWMLIAGTGHYLPYLRRLGVVDRTVYLPYGAIEAEPSLPFTNIDPGAIRGALAALDDYPDTAGVLGNVQCPLLQLPQSHSLLSALWEHGKRSPPEGESLRELSRLLHPADVGAVTAAFSALNASTPSEIGSTLARLRGILEPPGAAGPRAGLVGRLLFPAHAQVLQDLAWQLALRNAEAALACALDERVHAAGLTPLLTDYFRRCLLWEAKHGYFRVLEVGRLASLFPRPPVPRDTIRTWPPFLPYARGLRAVLAAAGDPRGEGFFDAIRRELVAEFDPAKVDRGCIEAMRVMMGREQAR